MITTQETHTLHTSTDHAHTLTSTTSRHIPKISISVDPPLLKGGAPSSSARPATSNFRRTAAARPRWGCTHKRAYRTTSLRQLQSRILHPRPCPLCVSVCVAGDRQSLFRFAHFFFSLLSSHKSTSPITYIDGVSFSSPSSPLFLPSTSDERDQQHPHPLTPHTSRR